MAVTIITAHIKKIIIILVCLLAFILFFTNVENLKISINQGIRFCVFSLVPSIFIFMIISSFSLYSSAFSGILNRVSNKTFNKIGICRKYFSVIILCSLCGFVNGPKILCEDYKKNGGNEVAFSNAIILSSNAGLGFLISCVGVGVWHDIWLGIYLYFAQISSAIILGKLILKKDFESLETNPKNEKSPNLCVAFTQSVVSSVFAIITICAFVVVFSAFTSVVLSVLNIEENTATYAIVSILVEFCRGSFLVFNADNILFSAFLTGFCIGFGGICVHFQTFAVCEGFPLNKFQFVLFKAIHGLLCGFLCVIYMLFKNFLL